MFEEVTMTDLAAADPNNVAISFENKISFTADNLELGTSGGNTDFTGDWESTSNSVSVMSGKDSLVSFKSV